MDKINFSSQVTFLYFEDLEKAQKFFDEVLKLERIFDPGWACIWKVSEKAFIGAVDVTRGSIKVETRGGFLMSLTVDNIEEVYEKFLEYDLEDMSELKYFEDIDLKSFFFTGPEGYNFEIQQFNTKEINDLF